MPFSHTPKIPGDLIKSQDWNTALDAVTSLFNKLHQATGHQHTGALDDGPPIGTGGIADGAISSAKVQDAAITIAKIAAGVIPNIGVAATMGLGNEALIPVPAGFDRTECIFYAALKTVPAAEAVLLSWDASGKLSITGGQLASCLAIGKKGGWV